MITTDSIKTAVTKIAQLMEESADELNAADGLLGDGDLGITMVRGFREIIEVRDSLSVSYTHLTLPTIYSV